VAEYNAKINSLNDSNGQLVEENKGMISLEDGTPMSRNTKAKMIETLGKVDPAKLAQAQSLADSVNLAVEYNIKQNITANSEGSEDDVQIDIDQTVVMITVSDKLLFNTGSYRINPKAEP